MKAKNVVILCVLSLVLFFCGPQQPQKTTGTIVQFPTSTQSTQPTSSSTPTTTTTTTQPPATTTVTTPQPISSGFIIDKSQVATAISASDLCLQLPASAKAFNVIFDIESNQKVFNLGLEVYICNANVQVGSALTGSISQYVTLNKKKWGPTLSYSQLDMAPDVTTTANEYGFVPSQLATNWRSSQGRYDQAIALKQATEERYQFKCDTNETFLMTRGTFYITSISTSIYTATSTGSPQMVPATYHVIIVLRRTPDGAFLGAMKWDKVNQFAEYLDIKIPCSIFN